MRRRAGFTLIEVLVSIVLTAVVSLLVYGAVQAARDTQARLAGERHAMQRALAMRLLLENALANAQPGFLAPDTVFLLEKRATTGGVPRDRLTFVTAGDLPPLAPGADWVVTLEPTPQGLRLTGAPIGVRRPSRLLARLPGVTGLAIRVGDPSGPAAWSPEWNFPAVLPSAVELTYWSDSARIGLPLTVSLALGQVR